MERKISTRLKNLGEYVFFGVAEAKKKAVQSGKDIIDLGGGNPDLPPHPKIIEALKKEAERKVEDSKTQGFRRGR